MCQENGCVLVPYIQFRTMLGSLWCGYRICEVIKSRDHQVNLATGVDNGPLARLKSVFNDTNFVFS
jgi:hypothetical protein